MMPIQRDRTPVSPSEISNAVLEESNVELIIAGKTSVSPKKYKTYCSNDKCSQEKKQSKYNSEPCRICLKY